MIPRIELRGVSKGYGTVTALDGIDLSVAQGDVVVCIGPADRARARSCAA
ncbi:MAG: hypothetical protein HC813_00205 [Planctomycetes bacterium]|nr:hypothetical protein [Planctomycetota bacterium]